MKGLRVDGLKTAGIGALPAAVLMGLRFYACAMLSKPTATPYLPLL